MSPLETHGILQPLLGTFQDFSLKCDRGDLLAEKNLHTVAQLLEVSDLTGHLTTDENRALMDKLTLFLNYSANSDFQSIPSEIGP